jgi:small conductance mechanosensitive channel
VPPLEDLTTWLRSDGLEIVLLLLGSVLATRLLHWLAQRFESRIGVGGGGEIGVLTVAEQSKRRAAVAQALERTAVALVCFFTAVLVLVRLGLPITSMVAPATVAGVALGFGAQRVVADLLAGFFIISENQYGLGDLVQISQPGSTTGVTGTVEAVSLRTTQLRMATGELVTLPNGEARQVTNRSRDWNLVVVDAPIPLDADVDVAVDALRDAAARLAGDDEIGPFLLDEPAVTGVQSIELGFLRVRVAARTTPMHAIAVGVALRRRAAQALTAAGLTTSLSFSTTEAKAGAGVDAAMSRTVRTGRRAS